jgi:MoaD family protein
MRINFYATLRSTVGQKTVDLPLPDGADVRDLAHEIVRRWPTMVDRLFDSEGDISSRVQFMIGGRNMRWLPDGSATRLTANDVVDVFPPTAGG